MSMDHNSNGSANDRPITDSEMLMAQPIWERRGKKRRGFGGGASAAPAVAPEPRTFDEPEMHRRDMNDMAGGMAGGAMAASEPVYRDQPHLPVGDVHDEVVIDPVTAAPMAAAVDEEPMLMAGPIGRTTTTTTTRKAKSSAAPAALALGLVAVAGLGAAGWYATQGGDDGVPEIATSEAVAPAGTDYASNGTLVGTPAATPAAPAVAAAAEPPRAATRIERSAPVRTASRTRPAAASVGDTSVNASATVGIPAAPQPYSGAPTSPATSATSPATVNPAPTTPAPAQPPAAIPATPPVDAAPAPAAAPTESPAPAPTEETAPTPAP